MPKMLEMSPPSLAETVQVVPCRGPRNQLIHTPMYIVPGSVDMAWLGIDVVTTYLRMKIWKQLIVKCRNRVSSLSFGS